MFRKIKSDFTFVDNDIIITIIDILDGEVNTTMYRYDLSSFQTITDVHFYNKVIDDFNAEFDDDLAMNIGHLIDLIIKDYKKEEDE